MIRKTENVLLAQRPDGMFLKLREEQWSTSHHFTDDAGEAKRISPYNKEELTNPKEATYYFENSWRAREIWLVDCIMVGYEITTEITSKKLLSASP